MRHAIYVKNEQRIYVYFFFIFFFLLPLLRVLYPSPMLGALADQLRDGSFKQSEFICV